MKFFDLVLAAFVGAVVLVVPTEGGGNVDGGSSSLLVDGSKEALPFGDHEASGGRVGLGAVTDGASFHLRRPGSTDSGTAGLPRSNVEHGGLARPASSVRPIHALRGGSLSASGLSSRDISPIRFSRKLDAITAVEQSVSLVVGSLVDASIATQNEVLTGHASCLGTFTVDPAMETTKSVWPDSTYPSSGVILSSGAVSSVQGPNNADGTSDSFGTSSHSIFGSGYNDACVLEFEFLCIDNGNPDDTTVSFKYVFGSDEYNEYVFSDYNDQFRLLLNGNDIALLPVANGGGEVEIDSVNNVVNSALYNDNDFGDTTTPYNIEMDGFTNVLTAVGQCDPSLNGGWNQMKIGVADKGDSSLNSWVLLKADSFVQGPPPADVPPTASCKDPFVLSLDTSGAATITVDDIDNDSSDSCNGAVTLSINQTDFHCSHIGDNVVALTVTDACGNVATCNTIVTVADVTAPEIIDCGIPHPVTPPLFPFDITPTATDACTSSSQMVYSVGNLYCEQYKSAKNLFSRTTPDKDCVHSGLTFIDGAGVFTEAAFDLIATDEAGNESTKKCRFLNNHPVKSRCLDVSDCGPNGADCVDHNCVCDSGFDGPLCDIDVN